MVVHPDGERYTVLADLLVQLRDVLQAQGLWQSQPPAPEALVSNEPFCVDTLSFEQWLQWVMIARFEAIIEARLPLPERCEIAPYAEESLQQGGADEADVMQIVVLIGQIDRTISA